MLDQCSKRLFHVVVVANYRFQRRAHDDLIDPLDVEDV